MLLGIPAAVRGATSLAQNIAQNAARNTGVLNAESRSSFGEISGKLSDITNYNNAWTAKQADKAMRFNRDEAAKNRSWQEYMSNTAHQREVKDLVAAGLNPILSVTGGSGAPVTSGATASGYAPSADTTLGSGLISLFSGLLARQTELANKALDAQTNLAVADKYNATSKYTAELQSYTQLSTANINAMASRYAADRHVDASRVAASINAAAQKYGYDVSAMTQRDIALFNGVVNAELKRMDIDAQFDLREAYPSNFYQMIGSLQNALTGDTGKGLAGFNSMVDAVLDDYLGRQGFGGGRK